jgi:hypothetical protein
LTGLAGGVANLLDSPMFGGAKLKFWILAVVAEYKLYLKGYSCDENVSMQRRHLGHGNPRPKPFNNKGSSALAGRCG